MTEALPPLDRLLVLEELRRLQARLCDAAVAREWTEVDALFSADGRFRAYEIGGELACFTSSPGIGAALEHAVGAGRVVLSSSDEELDALAEDRADGTWTIDDSWYADDGDRAVHGAGSLALGYRREDGQWRIATAEYTRTAREPA
ncbi:nuclear transport factor 2 family protein [Agromyces seonyuensis]|uniref:SnoaL-like domain-containing protein n=1 Tax=Agromyces seonyuensis TaxID=2662446 RepID=A0A6I4NZH5_9MICO|nr:nuclear transport factor 2 family protein [Agromyces seonyuensis]MWB97835.1 hypothetical protein [Agromyces seonyuensis]